ncbi:MAG: cyclic nucleotide-binding domain-containing protein [Candidatus Kapaibacterium sp.]
MISILDLIGHLFNILYVVAASFKKMIWLRSTLVLASIMEIYYYWNITDSPLWTDIIWSVVFIATNIWWVSVLYYEKLTLNLGEHEKKMLEITFSKMNPIHFKKLVRLGTMKVVPENTSLVKENTHINELMLITKGLVKITRNEKVLAYVKDGRFVGEMSFMSGETTTADCDTLEETEMIVWNKEILTEFLKKNDNIKKELNDVFSEDLIKKLVADN